MINVELTQNELLALESITIAALVQLDEWTKENNINPEEDALYQELSKARAKLIDALKEEVNETNSHFG